MASDSDSAAFKVVKFLKGMEVEFMIPISETRAGEASLLALSMLLVIDVVASFRPVPCNVCIRAEMCETTLGDQVSSCWLSYACS